jgi:hypothetical protein
MDAVIFEDYDNDTLVLTIKPKQRTYWDWIKSLFKK